MRYTLPFVGLFLITLSSCSLLGIHKNVTIPKSAGKYPKFSESTRLLGTLGSKYRACFDAAYYKLDITVDEKKKFLKGKVEMQALATAHFDTIQLDLFPNMKINSIGYTTMTSIDEKNSKLVTTTYYRKHGAVYVVMKQRAGERFKVVIDYEGKPVVAKKPPWKGGFVWKKDKEGNPWIGVACESEGASLWWPCKDVTNDEPDSVSINITTSKDLVAVANGTLTGKEENGALTTYRWKVSYPINLYDVSIYVGKFVLLADLHTMPSGKILPVNHYVLSMNSEIAKKHLAQAKDHIAFFEKKFGEYPWYHDGYKLVESPYEGMEHQTAIAYGNGYKNGNFPFDYIILHESAHEWWGNAITAADLSDVWLQEGFATYSEALYVEQTQGKNAYYRYMLFYRLFIKNKWPVVGPTDRRYFDYRNSDCYQKGAWVLHTLRAQVNNDSIFFDILKSFYLKHRYKTCRSQDFIDMVNEKTNDEYSWFFKQYLNRREPPLLEYYWDGKNFYYRWTNVDADFKMPVEIMLDNMIKTTLQPKRSNTLVQVIPISNETYKSISFDDAFKLYATQENKKLAKMGVIVQE